MQKPRRISEWQAERKRPRVGQNHQFGRREKTQGLRLHALDSGERALHLHNNGFAEKKPTIVENFGPTTINEKSPFSRKQKESDEMFLEQGEWNSQEEQSQRPKEETRTRTRPSSSNDSERPRNGNAVAPPTVVT